VTSSTFHLLAARDVGAAEDRFYPAPGGQPDSVVRHPEDGQSMPPMVAKGLIVREIPPGGSPQRLAWFKDITAAIGITESRLTVACSKYLKGGGWVPWTPAAIPLALTANVLSKRKVAQRRQGKMLVGHIRYPLLVSVGIRSPTMSIGYEQLRLGTIDPTQQDFRGLILDISLPGNYSGAVVAQHIASHAARYRLGSGEELTDVVREHLEQLRDPKPLQPVPKQFASYFFTDTSHSDMAAAFERM
jgi:hypothetical protein